MSRWTEAQLREYRKKKSIESDSQPSNVGLIDEIEFTLPRPTITLNELLHLSRWRRTTYARRLSDEISRLLPPEIPGIPFEKAKVRIVRRSVRDVDDDNARGGVKILVDTLLIRSSVHPNGLGLCVDDSPTHMIQDVKAERVKKRVEQKTIVTITRIT